MHKETVIITRYFFPNKVVDSESVYQMIKGIYQIDPTVKITVVTTNRNYKSQILTDEVDQTILKNVKVHEIKSSKKETASKGLTFIYNLIEGYKLVNAAKKTNIKNIISLTNPPLIIIWCNILLKKRNFFYWSFDLFPDAFVGDNILSSKSLIYSVFNKLAYWRPPYALVALGDCQYKYLSGKFNADSINKIILPCGVHNQILDTVSPPPKWTSTEYSEIILGYIGNIGRAHSYSFIDNMITAVINQTKFKLVLAIYGFHAAEIINRVKSLNSDKVILVDFIAKTELSFIDVNLVSLKKSWDNVSVPSKAVSAVCSGSCLWFCGSNNVDTWQMFKNCSFRSSNSLDNIEITLQGITRDRIKKMRGAALNKKDWLNAVEQNAYQKIIELL